MEENKRIEYNLVVKDNKLAVIDITNGIICDFDEIPETHKLLDLNNLPTNVLKNPQLFLKGDIKYKIFYSFNLKFLKDIDYQFKTYINNQLLQFEIDRLCYEMQQAIMMESGIPRNYLGTNLGKYIK